MKIKMGEIKSSKIKAAFGERKPKMQKGKDEIRQKNEYDCTEENRITLFFPLFSFIKGHLQNLR